MIGDTSTVVAGVIPPQPGSEDKTIKLWEAASGEEHRRLTGHTGTVSRVSFSSDGARLYSWRFGLKNRSAEKAYRAFKAKPKPYWHRQQTEETLNRQAWFAAAFHAAWWLELKPDLLPAFNALQNAHGQLDDKVAVLLPSVVAESLTISNPPIPKH